MYCKECGAEIPDDSKHCKECGAKLLEDSNDLDVVNDEKNELQNLNKKYDEKKIIYDVDAPEVKEAIANGAKLNYLGKEKIHGQALRIITILIGLIIGTVIFPIIGSIIGAGIGYWIAKEERDMYFLEYPE